MCRRSKTPNVATAATPMAPAATKKDRGTPLARRADVHRPPQPLVEAQDHRHGDEPEREQAGAHRLQTFPSHDLPEMYRLARSPGPEKNSSLPHSPSLRPLTRTTTRSATRST